MRRRVVVIDTSILCCWLRVPGKVTAGSGSDRWDHRRASALLAEEEENGSGFVLPLAGIIETGNHIAQAKTGDRFAMAKALADLIIQAAQSHTPWIAFTRQADLWTDSHLLELARTWPEDAKARLSLGDATIRDVAESFARSGYEVGILTADAGLKAYEPASPPPVPRRRQRE